MHKISVFLKTGECGDSLRFNDCSTSTCLIEEDELSLIVVGDTGGWLASFGCRKTGFRNLEKLEQNYKPKLQRFLCHSSTSSYLRKFFLNKGKLFELIKNCGLETIKIIIKTKEKEKDEEKERERN